MSFCHLTSLKVSIGHFYFAQIGHYHFAATRPEKALHKPSCNDTIPSKVVRDYSQVTAEELLEICVDLGHVDAWNEFLRRFHSLVISVLVRTARRYTRNYTQEIDDLEAEVYLRLCANQARALRAFVPRHPGSAYQYIKVIAVCTAHDHFKRTAGNSVEDFPLENLVERDVLEWRMLIQDVDRILRRKTSEGERQLFWLYYQHGLTAKAIAAMPTFSLSVKGVESAYGRLGRMVRRELAVPPSSGGGRESRGKVVSEGSA